MPGAPSAARVCVSEALTRCLRPRARQIQSGVLVNSVPLDELQGMVRHYDEPYSHATRDEELQSVPAAAKWVFVGAWQEGSPTVAVGAFGRREAVLQRTERNQPHEHNGVWWYLTDGQSFGFAASPNVGRKGCAPVHQPTRPPSRPAALPPILPPCRQCVRPAALTTALPRRRYLVDAADPADPARLSWGLHGLGGYRAGTHLGVGAWHKMIYYTSRYADPSFSHLETGRPPPAADASGGEASGEPWTLPTMRSGPGWSTTSRGVSGYRPPGTARPGTARLGTARQPGTARFGESPVRRGIGSTARSFLSSQLQSLQSYAATGNPTERFPAPPTPPGPLPPSATNDGPHVGLGSIWCACTCTCPPAPTPAHAHAHAAALNLVRAEVARPSAPCARAHGALVRVSDARCRAQARRDAHRGLGADDETL